MGNKLIALLFIVGILLFIATPASAAKLDDELNSRMEALKMAFMQHDGNAIKEIMTRDGLIVTPYYTEALGPGQVVEKFRTLNIKKHSSYKVSITPLSAKTALMTMYTSFEGSFEDKPVSAWLFTSSLWVKEQGLWRLKLLQETIVEAP
ncbi:DUF4440 domain-containing protein [Microbulbifer sp. SSSA007]|uniref:DUF4440 domain-containing protein n=1 Tax=Microbulbifer sp. SSSA007 TaxID=3243379 RepID=UPI00403A3820